MPVPISNRELSQQDHRKDEGTHAYHHAPARAKASRQPSSKHGAGGNTEAFRQKGQASKKRGSANDLLEVECNKEGRWDRSKGDHQRDEHGSSKGVQAEDAKGN